MLGEAFWSTCPAHGPLPWWGRVQSGAHCEERAFSLVVTLRLLLLQGLGSGACGLPGLWCLGLAILQHVRSSGTKGQACLSCFGRQILYHGASTEAQLLGLLIILHLSPWLPVWVDQGSQ